MITSLSTKTTPPTIINAYHHRCWKKIILRSTFVARENTSMQFCPRLSLPWNIPSFSTSADPETAYQNYASCSRLFANYRKCMRRKLFKNGATYFMQLYWFPSNCFILSGSGISLVSFLHILNGHLFHLVQKAMTRSGRLLLSRGGLERVAFSVHPFHNG